MLRELEDKACRYLCTYTYVLYCISADGKKLYIVSPTRPQGEQELVHVTTGCIPQDYIFSWYLKYPAKRNEVMFDEMFHLRTPGVILILINKKCLQ